VTDVNGKDASELARNIVSCSCSFDLELNAYARGMLFISLYRLYFHPGLFVGWCLSVSRISGGSRISKREGPRTRRRRRRGRGAEGVEGVRCGEVVSLPHRGKDMRRGCAPSPENFSILHFK